MIFVQFIAQQLAEKRYASSSELVRAALRLLEGKEANSALSALREVLREGEEESGDAGVLDMEKIRRMAKKEACPAQIFAFPKWSFAIPPIPQKIPWHRC